MIVHSQWNKPPRSEQRCGNCNAFLPNKGKPPPEQPRQGACAAGRPSLMQGMGVVPGSQLSPQGPQMMPVVQGAWPPTSEERWCREWEGTEDG